MWIEYVCIQFILVLILKRAANRFFGSKIIDNNIQENFTEEHTKSFFLSICTILIFICFVLMFFLPSVRLCLPYHFPVVSQFYDTDVNKAYVIRGNAAILKCEIPSFVADFVSVVSWHTDQDEVFYPANDYGLCAFFSEHIYKLQQAACTKF